MATTRKQYSAEFKAPVAMAYGPKTGSGSSRSGWDADKRSPR